MNEPHDTDATRPVWERVQEQLDQRLDPLDDPAIRDALAADPVLAAEVLSLCDTLALCETGWPLVRQPAPPGLRRPLLVPALLTAALILWCCWLVGPMGQPANDPVRISRAPMITDAPDDPPPAILSFTLTLTRSQGDETRQRTLSGDETGVSQTLAHHTPGHSTRWTERIRR